MGKKAESGTPVNFEVAMKELENILAKMSGDDISLDESIALYADAAQLVEQCSVHLREARERVGKIGVRLQELGESDEF